MIEQLSIRNFKSLRDVELSLTAFTCLVGLNGAGKSSWLQAIDFIAQQMRGDIDVWLDARGWEAKDLDCKLTTERNIHLGVVMLLDGQRLRWEAAFNTIERRCTHERFLLGDSVTPELEVKAGELVLSGERQRVRFKYQGSIISALRDDELVEPIVKFRDYLTRVRSLELLSPHLLRRRARVLDEDIGAGGEKLSAFLSGLSTDARAELLVMLRSFYPALEDFRVSNLKAGWKKLTLVERYGETLLETEAGHVNDGLLRILAVLAQAHSDRSLVLLDEIENGINPELVEKLVDTLVSCKRQIVVTTHSPLFLNYLDDEVAKQSVVLIYKSPAGESRARHLFTLPRIADKLRIMGPGEAFVDTDLPALIEECVAEDRMH
ncbi:chromosome segregation protein SMC [Pseudomonas oryzihabitans]|nr:chromosome segregation protein SMC [Pseudomonas psychrotolerans]